MKKHRHHVTPRFDASARELLEKLCRTLGSDNVHEAEAARSRIDSLLQKFGKSWVDLVALLSGGAVTVQPDLAGNIAELGNSDPKLRAAARAHIAARLAQHQKNWNDFIDALCGITPASWLGATAADPKRVNPLALTIHLLKEYVALRDDHEYIMVPLWILHTHVFRQFMVTPRLALRSPVAACGKTQLLDVISRLAANAEKFDSITTAAIYRLIDASHPTLLIDEADNLGIALQPNGRLRAVFNSGHRNGGSVAISERGETRRFSTFAPLALALPDAMAGLPRTLNSRCITLTMQRSQRELRRLEPYRPDAALGACYQQILLWCNDVELDADPEMPKQLRNRLADNWRPLLSIADSLGMGEEARKAAIAFADAFQDADVRILALIDIRTVFDANAVDRLPSKMLLDALHALDDSDWTEFRGIRGDQSPHRLKAGELAGMLREFGIKPRVIWPLKRTTDSISARGYLRSSFEQAWRMYCSDEGVTPSQPSKIRTLRLAGDDT
jgi:Protein of unknown function (DUF3631)